MTIGKITSSQQNIVFASVRVEDDTFIETHNGTIKIDYFIDESVGEEFTTTKWYGRLKIKMSNIIESGLVKLVIYDSPTKNIAYHDIKITLSPPNATIHLAFNPLPMGDYYWELERISGNIGISVVTNSTIHKAYKNGIATSDWDIESKIMYVGDKIDKPIAVVGDTIDSGVTTISSGSTLGVVMVASVEKNISRIDDTLTNDGKILTGCWFAELED